MNHFVHSEDVSVHAAGEFVADASELRLPVGVFPEELDTDMGNGCKFIRFSLTDECAVYRQLAGSIELTVFNE